MSGNINAYKLWAPSDALWTDWAKPVMFANMQIGPSDVLTRSFKDAAPASAMPAVMQERKAESLSIPELIWMPRMDLSTAVIVDLPGRDGVLEGLALARLGYRPVPLYNGTSVLDRKVITAVSVDEIQNALSDGAAELQRLRIKPDAPPAFLLDSNRMTGFDSQPGKFDNRWRVLPQDMPSFAHLKSKGIRKVIVRAEKIHDDLAHVLYRYQAQEIAIYQNDGRNQKQAAVAKPSRFRRLFYRFGILAGLMRNSAGGFGAIVPESRSGSG